jgi:hypothetical protein
MPRSLGLLGAIEEVRVDAQRDVGGSVSKLSRGEDDVRAAPDKQAGEGVSLVVPASSQM